MDAASASSSLSPPSSFVNTKTLGGGERNIDIFHEGETIDGGGEFGNDRDLPAPSHYFSSGSDRSGGKYSPLASNDSNMYRSSKDAVKATFHEVLNAGESLINTSKNSHLFSNYLDDVGDGEAPSQKSNAVIITKNNETILRWTHVASLAGFTVAFILSVIPFYSISETTTQGVAYYNKTLSGYESYQISAGSVSINGIVPVFFMVMLLYNFFASLCLWDVVFFFDYIPLLRKRINPLYWLTNAAAYPMVTMTVALVVGIREATTLAMIFVATATVYLMFYCVEFIQYFLRTRIDLTGKYFREPDMILTIYIPLIANFLLFSVVWSTIITYQAVSDEDVPSVAKMPGWAIATIYIGFVTQFYLVASNLVMYFLFHWGIKKYFFVSASSIAVSTVGTLVVGFIILFSNINNSK